MLGKIEPLFVSHGAPDLALAETAASNFLRSLALESARPRAILTVSAHFEATRPTVVRDAAPGMIYDFGGFDERLRSVVYPAPGAPELAGMVASLLREAGQCPDVADHRGYDHGVWVPLLLLYPDANIPIAQLSVNPEEDAAWHYAIGEALRPLTDEGVLVLGSGSLTHNLAEIFGSGGMRPRAGTVESWVSEFAEWIAERLAAGDKDALLDYRDRAPYAARNHPTGEHLMPLFVALGAAGRGAVGRRIHESVEFAVLAMDAYRFEIDDAA